MFSRHNLEVREVEKNFDMMFSAIRLAKQARQQASDTFDPDKRIERVR